MSKFTRTAFTGSAPSHVLAEIVNLAYLKDLPFNTNADLHSRRHAEEHPDEVRITISVERVKPQRKRAARPSPELGRAFDSLLGEDYRPS